MYFRTKDILRGIDITYVTLYRWIKEEGMPFINKNPYGFDKKAVDWIIKNKPDYAEKAKKMMEG